jgi:hypothetical protein
MHEFVSRLCQSIDSAFVHDLEQIGEKRNVAYK